MRSDPFEDRDKWCRDLISLQRACLSSFHRERKRVSHHTLRLMDRKGGSTWLSFGPVSMFEALMATDLEGGEEKISSISETKTPKSCH